MSDILDDLRDLYVQATTENSHYYTAKCIERAISEIAALRLENIRFIVLTQDYIENVQSVISTMRLNKNKQHKETSEKKAASV